MRDSEGEAPKKGPLKCQRSDDLGAVKVRRPAPSVDALKGRFAWNRKMLVNGASEASPVCSVDKAVGSDSSPPKSRLKSSRIQAEFATHKTDLNRGGFVVGKRRI